jgi:hypothetical protein
VLKNRAVWTLATAETWDGLGEDASAPADGADIELVRRFGSGGSVLRPFDEASRARRRRRSTGGARLGELLLAEELLTELELADALAEQKKSRPKKQLGEILLRRGLVSAPVLVRLLATQCQLDLQEETGFGCGLRRAIELRHQTQRAEPTETEATDVESDLAPSPVVALESPPEAPAVPEAPRRLGELLVEKGLLTDAQLDAALAEQEDSGRLLGEIIVDHGYVPMITLVNVLTEQLNGQLETQGGFGTGLREMLEAQLLQRRDQAA